MFLALVVLALVLGFLAGMVAGRVWLALAITREVEART